MGDAWAVSRAWKDTYTLLCERCGYVIDGLPGEGVCPECGLAIELSLPANRPGTPWQRRRGWVPMVWTWWLTLRHPVLTLDRLAVGPPRVRAMFMLAAWPMALLASIVLLLLFEVERPLANGGTVAWTPGGFVDALVLSLVMSVLLTPCIAAFLAGLTWVEARGLVLFGSQRGLRVHPELALTIVRHGATGWLLCGLGAMLALPLAWSHESELSHAFGRGPFQPSDTWTILLAGGGFVISLAGFLWFEFFAWLGLRRCRFANRARAGENPDIGCQAL